MAKTGGIRFSTADKKQLKWCLSDILFPVTTTQLVLLQGNSATAAVEIMMSYHLQVFGVDPMDLLRLHKDRLMIFGMSQMNNPAAGESLTTEALAQMWMQDLYPRLSEAIRSATSPGEHLAALAAIGEIAIESLNDRIRDYNAGNSSSTKGLRTLLSAKIKSRELHRP